MSDTKERETSIRMLFRSKSALDAKVAVMRLGLTMADLYSIYKDAFAGKESARATRKSTPAHVLDYLPPAAVAVQMFDKISNPPLPREKPWEVEYCARLESIHAEISHIRTGISALCSGVSISDLSWGIANLPVHNLNTPEDVLYHLHNSVNFGPNLNRGV